MGDVTADRRCGLRIEGTICASDLRVEDVTIEFTLGATGPQIHRLTLPACEPHRTMLQGDLLALSSPHDAGGLRLAEAEFLAKPRQAAT